MPNPLGHNSIVIGVDVHKYSHTAVAMDCFGQEKGMFEFSNIDLPSYISWLSAFGNKENLIVALEDVNGYGVHLVSELVANSFPIRYVPAILTERDRKRSTQRDKSDYHDAKRIGKVILTKYEETLPARESIANKNELETATNLDLLLTERRDLVSGQTILKNQLHALLHQYYGDNYQKDFSKIFNEKALAFYLKDLSKKSTNKVSIQALRAQSIIRRIKRIKIIKEQIEAITDQLSDIGEDSPQVVALTDSIHGCGLVTACVVVSEVTTVKRFKNKAQFAKYSGVAPTHKSSGSKTRLHTNPFGNRTLNRALHTIALSQIACKGDKKGKEYYQKKLKEGKTKLWALRCLKRQLSNKVFQVLKYQGKESEGDIHKIS